MRSNLFKVFVVLLFAAPAHAEVSADDMNASNNPLTPMAALSLHDYIQSSVFGTDESLNTFYLRAALPNKIGGMPQLTRMTVPYQTSLESTGDKITAMGDISVFDIFLLGGIVKGMELGIGPLFVFPTASEDETGAGKWQIGAAGVVMTPQAWGMLGALITYQHDFAGEEDRPTQNIATAQPLIIYNFPQGYYLRSTGIWYFNWENGSYYIPVGIGAGKVWKLESGTTVNAFVEPQWTVAHEGDFVPNYQTFVGLNFQFPLQ
jgi:hypothetical protein